MELITTAGLQSSTFAPSEPHSRANSEEFLGYFSGFFLGSFQTLILSLILSCIFHTSPSSVGVCKHIIHPGADETAVIPSNLTQSVIL